VNDTLPSDEAIVRSRNSCSAAQVFSNHTVQTAHEKGWSNLKNGDLFSRAVAEGFDALVTTDQNLRHQQNLTNWKISIVVLLTTNWPRIRNHVDIVVQAKETLASGSYLEIAIP